jgi:hypothetical protein
MSFEEPDTTEEHEKRITRCSSCRAMIIWLPHVRTRKNHPVDADTVRPEHWDFDPDLGHISHFATCPNAAHHRKKR